MNAHETLPTRRAAIGLAACAGLSPLICGAPMHAQGRAASRITTGAEAAAKSGFAMLAGKRVGLITNHTGLVGTTHLADMIAGAKGVTLAAILAPEHGFRGAVEAGLKVRDDRDPKTGAPVFSLYGATRKPTPAMLAGLDVLVFDIQDIGARFYTYISTMGLAMQAAAAAKIPFVVLDRPNPLGGDYVAGFALEPQFRSFVGQYTIPIVHGLTVGELAQMIKGEQLLGGLAGLDLSVVKLDGWRRGLRFADLGRAWVPTSPNIPTFDSALVYPGIGMVGELEVSEGRGTAIPFQQFGAPWMNAKRMAAALTAQSLPGLRFEAVTYVPRAIPGVAATPRFLGKTVNAVRIHVTDHTAVQPLELGMHALALIVADARAMRQSVLPVSLDMFRKIAGTTRLHEMLVAGAGGSALIGSWQKDVADFKLRRAKYLLYPS